MYTARCCLGSVSTSRRNAPARSAAPGAPSSTSSGSSSDRRAPQLLGAQAVDGDVAGHAEQVGAGVDDARRATRLRRRPIRQAQPGVVQAVGSQVFAAQAGAQAADQPRVIGDQEIAQTGPTSPDAGGRRAGVTVMPMLSVGRERDATASTRAGQARVRRVRPRKRALSGAGRTPGCPLAHRPARRRQQAVVQRLVQHLRSPGAGRSGPAPGPGRLLVGAQPLRQAGEPTEQQVVGDLLQEVAAAAHRIQQLQDERAAQHRRVGA